MLRYVSELTTDHKGGKIIMDQATDKKQQIIDKAIEFFSKNGVADTTIEEITNAIGIGKGTLYLYFNGKKDLLLNCIERLTTMIISKDVWLDIREETNYKLRFQKRLIAFLKAYPTFCGILSLVNQSLDSNDPELSKQAENAYRLLIGPLMKDLRWAVRHGWVKEIDDEIFAFIMMAIGEGLGTLLKINPRKNIEELAEFTWDFMINGIGSSTTEKLNEAGSLYWELQNHDDSLVHIRDFCCNERSYLSGTLGKGTLQVPLHKVNTIEIFSAGNMLSATVTMISGKSVNLIIDPETNLTGETEFGRYQVVIRQISKISAILAENVPTMREG